MLLSAKINRTKIKAYIAVIAVLFVIAPLYFANAGFLEDIFYGMVVFFFGGLTGLCGSVLNYAVQHFVVGFSSEFNSPQMNQAIGVIWTLVRDLFNITFIFGLVYIGFIMILKSDSSNTRKWLINLVIAALLVNFSLLISKLVIDVTNMTATQLLNAGLQSEVFIQNTNGEVDFSGSMMKQLGINEVFKDQTNGTGNQPKLAAQPPTENAFGYSMMLMLIFLITAFTFLSAGIMLIIRGAALILFMVFSPVMFLGFVIPGLMKTTRRYWTEFFGRALFAPVYILIVFVGMSIFQAIKNQSAISDAFSAQGFGGAQQVASTFGPFALFIVLMIASLNIAKQLGVEGASTAMNAFDSAKKNTAKNIRRAGMYGARKGTQAAGAATVGVGSAAMRHTLGRMSYNYTNSDKGKKLAAGGFASRQAAAVMKGLGNASYDPRSSKKDGMLGKSRQGGFAGHVERQEKKEKQRSKDLERGTYDHNGKPTDGFNEALKKDTQYSKASYQHEMLKTEHLELNRFLATEKENLTNRDVEINSLKARLEGAKAAGNDADVKTIERKIWEREKALEEEFKSTNEESINALKESTKNLTAAQKARDEATARVEGQYKYAFVGDLKKTRDNEQKMWAAAQKHTFGATISLGTAGAAAGLVAGPVGAIIGGAAGAALGAAIRGTIKKEVETAEARIGEITKEYGKDLDKKIKDKGKRDLAKMMKEMDKEFGEGTSGAAAAPEAGTS